MISLFVTRLLQVSEPELNTQWPRVIFQNSIRRLRMTFGSTTNRAKGTKAPLRSLEVNAIHFFLSR